MGNPEPLYLLVGPEEGEKRSFIKDTIEQHRSSSGEESEQHRFYAGEVDINEMISRIKNGSLFAAYKFVTLSNIEELKKAELKSLSEYIKNPEKSATLFLLSEEYKVPSSLENAIPKKKKKEWKKVFFEMFENKKRDWLVRYFRSAGVFVDEEAIEVLLELVENNTLEMKNAADRLILFFGSEKEITADKVEEFIYHSKEENVFTLFAHIAGRDFPSSLEILRKILLSGESSSVQIMGGLLWQFRRLLTLSIFLDKNYSADEALDKAGIRGKKNRTNYLQGSKNYATEELKKAVSLVSEYDGLIRQSPSNIETLLLDLFLFRLVNKTSSHKSDYYYKEPA